MSARISWSGVLLLLAACGEPPSSPRAHIVVPGSSAPPLATVAPTPAAKSKPPKVLDVGLGLSHTCALLDDHTVACWGNGAGGDLGDDVAWEATGGRPVAKRVLGVTGIGVAAGGRTSCAWSDHDMTCWGEHVHFLSKGALAVGSTTTPRAFPGITSPIDVSLRSQASCVIQADGALRCWGEAPIGSAVPGSPIASVVLAGGAKPKRVAVGGLDACVLTTDGHVQCWGTNGNGELGLGDTRPRATPLAVPGLSNVTQIGATGGMACALSADGLSCWGGFRCPPNADCETPDITVTRPKKIQGTGALRAFSLGAPLLGLRVDGTVVELDGRHMLHDGLAGAKSISGLSAVSAIASGAGHACALGSDGRLFCWGANESGQTGAGSLDAKRDAPVEVKLDDL